MEREKASNVNATDFGELASLPLGSLRSRAAARLLFEQRRQGERREDIVIALAGLPVENNGVSAEQKDRDGVIRRSIFISSEIPIAEGLRSLRVGGYSDAELMELENQWPDPQPEFNILVIER